MYQYSYIEYFRKDNDKMVIFALNQVINENKAYYYDYYGVLFGVKF